MTAFGADDLSVFYADFGVPIVFGTLTALGNVSVATEDFVAGDGFAIVKGETVTVRYPASDLPGLKAKDSITVDGVAHRVRHIDFNNDGLDKTAFVEELQR